MLSLLNRRIERSKGIIRQMLSLSHNPYLALSFGKDSLVMMDLVREQYPDVPCLFLKSEETYLLHNYEEVIPYYINRGVNIEIVEMRHLDYDFEIGGANNEFQQPAFFRGWDGVFMGLRIEERKGRKYSLISKQNNTVGDKIMQYRNGPRKGMYRCCPMAFWTGFEVFFYLQQKGMKMLEAYINAGVRTSAQLPFSNVLPTTLQQLKTRDISKFNQLVEMIPELKYYG